MKNYADTEEMLSVSPLISDLAQCVRGRLKGYRLEERTHTGPEPVGNEPFLSVFEERPNDPYAICLAHAIVRSWLEAPVVIYDEDLIVGVPRPRMVLGEHFSRGIKYAGDLLQHPAYAGQRDEIERRIRAQWDRLFPLSPAHHALLGKELFGDAYQTVCSGLWAKGYQGHTVPDYPKLLECGMGAVADEIRGFLNQAADENQRVLYRALLVIMDGFADYVHLYADAAQKKAEETGNSRFLLIAQNCRAIARGKPQTLFQAVQLLWFYCLWDWVDCVGRFDQYMMPFFSAAQSCDEPASAEDMIAALYLKFQEHGVHNICLGGVRPQDGADATNALTYLMLKLGRKLYGVHSRLQVRIHRQSPPELMALIVRMWADGLADPTLVSDETVIPGLMEYGVPIEDARDYSTLGCQEIEIPGKSNFGCEDGSINLAKILEYTLNDGCDRFSGIRVGLPTGHLPDYSSMEELWEAFLRQLRYLTPKLLAMSNEDVAARSANLSKLVKMPFTGDCLARGLDPDNGGAIYNYGVIETAGSSAVADSLAAIDQIVFREKSMSAGEMERAIAADFKGYEAQRRRMLNAPKFGNDHPLPDGYARRVLDAFWSELGMYTSRRGGAFTGACSLQDGGIGFGEQTWAMPDGCHAGAPLSNTIGPRPGADRSGVTAMLNSVRKLPLNKGVGGTTLNVLLPPSVLATRELREKVQAMMTAYLMEGGQMAQITVASLEDMRDAQRYPERHGNLMVRVGGYCARFVEVRPEIQNEIISRYGQEI